MATESDGEVPSIVLYSSKLTAELAGITYRQLDYWCRQGLFGPEKQGLGSGHGRRFTPLELRALRAIKRVLDVLEDLLGVSRQPGSMDLYRLVIEQVREGKDVIDWALGDYSHLTISLEGIE